MTWANQTVRKLRGTRDKQDMILETRQESHSGPGVPVGVKEGIAVGLKGLMCWEIMFCRFAGHDEKEKKPSHGVKIWSKGEAFIWLSKTSVLCMCVCAHSACKSPQIPSWMHLRVGFCKYIRRSTRTLTTLQEFTAMGLLVPAAELWKPYLLRLPPCEKTLSIC